MDADLTFMERELIQTLRAARTLYQGGDEPSAKDVLHFQAIPLLAACVQERELEMGPLTGARSRDMVEA